MPGKAAKVRVSERQLDVLQELSRSRTVAKGIVQRALILVLGVQGLRNEQIAVEVGLIRRQVAQPMAARGGSGYVTIARTGNAVFPERREQAHASISCSPREAQVGFESRRD